MKLTINGLCLNRFLVPAKLFYKISKITFHNRIFGMSGSKKFMRTFGKFTSLRIEQHSDPVSGVSL